ncbi:MAG: hypothetical protein J0M29_00585 [Chitinophagales bacterium]|nr:hypothetical protein [Chitinophagales bacterium]
MSNGNITICPGSESYAAYLEIRVPTTDALGWLESSRQSLTFLLEFFKETDLPNGDQIRANGVLLLSLLYPLPSQWKAGAAALATAPDFAENAGVYLTSEGLAIRFPYGGQFEQLHDFSRSLLALAAFCAYEVTEQTRREFFQLIEAIFPDSITIFSLLSLDCPLPCGYNFDKHERTFAVDMSIKNRAYAARLRRALDTTAERQNARWFKGFALLISEGAITEHNQGRLLEWVAVGLDAAAD